MSDAQTPATPDTPSTPATPATPSVAAGWYQDPSNAAQQRWWDGTQWTEQVSAPAYGSPQAYEQLKAPAGTSGNTPWIWLVVFLPLLGLLPLFFIDIGGYLEDSILYAGDPNGAMRSVVEFYTQPAMLLALGLSFVVLVGTILFAYLDWRELKRRGVPAPFHWAFSFLAIAGFGVVYPIGRAVVTKRRTGSGNGVLLATILTIVVSFIVAIVIAVLAVNYSVALIADI